MEQEEQVGARHGTLKGFRRAMGLLFLVTVE